MYCSYVIEKQILDTPPVSAVKSHSLSLDSLLGSIASDRLASHSGGRLVIRANPWCNCLRLNLSSDIGVNSR